MVRFFQCLHPLLDRPTQRRFGCAVAAMLALAVLEIVAFVALVPLMQILTAPNLRPNSAIVSSVRRTLGVSSLADLALYLGLLVIGIYIVKSIAALLVMRWTTTFALEQETRMVRRLMQAYLHAPYRVHLQRNSNEFMRTLEISLPQIFRIALVQCFNAVGDAFSVVFVGIVLAVTNPLIALVTAGYFGLVCAGYQRIVRRSLGTAAQSIHQNQAVELRTMHQAIMGVKEIRVRSAEEHFASEAYEHRHRLLRDYRTIALSGVNPRYVLELAMVGAAGVIALLAFATLPLASATATVAVFLAGGFRMLAPLNKIVFGLAQARSAIPAVEQLREDLALADGERIASQADSVLRLEPGQLQPRIALRDVTFSYAPGIPVLRGITLEVEPGEAVGLVGASGAGKSTLVDLLLGLFEPDRGEVLVQGWPLASVRPQWLRIVGYVPQTIALFDDTVRANVAFGVPPSDIDDDHVWDALAFAQLDDVVRSLPHGLDHLVGEAGVELSGGQRQRVGVARALYHDPKILMLDEATSALDNETEFKFTEVLESLRGRVTTITIAHRLSTVRRCDRLFYLDQGRLLADGTFTELSARIPGFARMVELAAVER